MRFSAFKKSEIKKNKSNIKTGYRYDILLLLMAHF